MTIELEPHAFELCTEVHIFDGIGPHCHWCDRPEGDEIHTTEPPTAKEETPGVPT